MIYTRGSSKARLEAIEARRAAAEAEALQAEADLAAILQEEQRLARTQRRRDRALAELLKIRDQFQADADAAEADFLVMREARLQIAAAAKQAAAVMGKVEKELRRAEEAEIDLQRLHRERHRAGVALRDKKTKALGMVQMILRPANLPEPVYGGREGLEMAAREAATHDRRNLRAVS
jgi:hypothetical protein